MKFGIECEGRFCGLKTLFINANELYSPEEMNYVISSNMTRNNLSWDLIKCKVTELQQIYISDNDNLLDLYSPMLKQWSARAVVTVERTALTEYPSYVNIMLNVPNASFWYLRKDCQFKFSKDMNVFSATKRALIETKPYEFEGDITL